MVCGVVPKAIGWLISGACRSNRSGRSSSPITRTVGPRLAIRRRSGAWTDIMTSAPRASASRA